MTAARTESASPPLTYDFGATGSGGVWLGLGAPRVALLGVGLLASILALTAGSPVPLAAVPILLCGGVTAARCGGRPLLDWVPPLGARAAASASGAVRWRASIPTLPLGRAAAGPIQVRLPAEFGRARIATCPDDPAIGMLTDASTRTITAVFEVCGVDRFPLLDTAEQDTLIAGWGDALAVLADTDDALARIQLVERARAGGAVERTLRDLGDVAAGESSWDSEITALATSHDSRLAAQWTFARLDDAAVATVAVRCHLLARALLAARLLTRPLSAAELSRDLLTALSGEGHSHARGDDGVGPVSRRTDWAHVTTDDQVHRSYAINSWPTAPVGAAWLAPLLLAAPAGVTRTVALHLERMAPAAAARIARTRRAKAVLDQSDRARLGMTSSAALGNAEASGVAMDAELAAGYRTHRIAGVITLTGDTLAALDEAAPALRQAAAVCRLELRPLHGQHDIGLAATLPLCRLRHRAQS
jgi:hypothetical protein